MMLPRVASILGVVAVGLTLAGCSVSETGNLGIRVHNHHVEALVMMCPGVTSSELTLQRDDSSIFRWFDPKWKFAATSNAAVDLGSTTRILQILGGGGFLVGNASNGVAGSLHVSPKTLGSLSEGDVLSANGTSETTVEDRAMFAKNTAELCNRYR